MLLNTWPVRFLITRAARAYGFLDPVKLVAKIRGFAQPSEFSEPIELLRAGMLFHARGLVNTKAIQNNLDWVWPYWVEKQFNPGDESFIPRAFSFSHINLTHRNWTAVGLPDVPGTAAQLFQVVAAAGVNIDMIVQNVSAARTGLTDISFTLPASDGAIATTALANARPEVGYDSLQYDDTIGKLSLVGAGMRSHPGVSAQLFAALSGAGINIEMISTSEIRISVVTRADSLDDAVRAVHTAFNLDSTADEAVVYGGTGR